MSIYSGLMEKGHSMVDIDDMDILYYFDILIHNAVIEERKTQQQYDNMGL